ncbi:muts domain V-domain-containing protein [Armillaria borealis]|uniref:DNA mismatch repair protein MSH3 n=1 Tax=Armillaria borealis TaxID=47425 RepID=A0AA39JG94_9AGAR|nr:muts domain V-domain-containing protein [Armillaria borealis]
MTGQSRPWTAQSRPATARPQTAASTRHDASYVIALLEGRGISREVGMAALDKDTGRVMLVQVSRPQQHCQTYVKTLHQMHLHSPCLILVPDTFLSASDASLLPSRKRAPATSLLVEFIREEFPSVPLEPIGRKYWNELSGMQFIDQLCVEDDERAGTLMAVRDKYFALSATSALFKHAEAKLNTRFAAGSLLIRYVPVDGTMMIDPETVRNLELVGNMSNKKLPHSLFGTVNHTFTSMASRLLRVNLLSIEARLDVVEEFVKSEDAFNNVKTALKPMNKMDFDKLIVSLASSETKPTTTAQGASTRVSQMLNLRNIVKCIPQLQEALAGCKSHLLRIVFDMVSDERIANIERLITKSLNEDTLPSKHGIGAVNARVHAVKANYNRLLDVARETYKENVGDIYALNTTLSEQHDLPLTLIYHDTGFVFSLKKSDVIEELPKGFINASLKKGRWQFSSMEIIQDLVADILVDVGALYKASEAIALVDMLLSFAHVSIIRPEFTGTLAVKAGKHPILETLRTMGTLVPNDVYCDDSSSFQIVQGPNTYLRQVGLLTVMAMCGCFVPAEYASFRIHDALLTRLSNDDDMEKSLSTFASEMATSAMILGLATPGTLILIDELGRGTSPREGVGISHAIAEALMEHKSFVFFATHFNELSTTLSRKPSVVNLHLSVQKSRPSESNFGMTFQYKIVDGAPDNMSHYGLELARLADLPSDVLTEAKRVSSNLSALHARNEENSESTQITTRRKALLRLRTQLKQALDHSMLPDEELLTYIGRFQRDITRAFLYGK